MVNRGIKQYSEREKYLYKKYGVKSRGRKTGGIAGRGAYRIGRPYIRGRGGYFSNMLRRIPKNFFNARKLGSNLGGAAGAAIGSMVAPGIGTTSGAAIGSSLGSELGGLFKKITGYGDYTVKSNTLIGAGNDRVVPSFGDDSIRVKKREFITYINATTAFTNNSFPINPGLSEVFPWLSAIANNYEQYRWNGLVFQFVSTSSDAIASTTNLGLGQVILASDYNAADAAFVDAPQMLGAMFSNSGKPSENILHAVECAPTDVPNKLFYTRSGDPPANSDIRLYDMLNFQIATQNMPADYTGMGQLWVTYDVTFCKSQQNNQLGFDINTDKYIITGASSSVPLGTSSVLAEHSNLGTSIDHSSGTVSFPVDLASGYYLINYSAQGSTGSTTLVDPALTLVNCTQISSWRNDSANQITSGGMTSGSGLIKYIMCVVLRIDARDATFKFGGAGTLAIVQTCDLLITQINGEIFGT